MGFRRLISVIAIVVGAAFIQGDALGQRASELVRWTGIIEADASQGIGRTLRLRADITDGWK
ncbi:MAG: hypothetical protein R3282_10175, partial [Rhodothermales bacterium]|nr:hypothetical protein [Rhodothermales bacterium]